MPKIALAIAAGLTALASHFAGSTSPEAGIDADEIRVRTCGYAAYAAVGADVPLPVEPIEPDAGDAVDVGSEGSVDVAGTEQPVGKSRQSAESSQTISDVAIDLLALAEASTQTPAPVETKPPEPKPPAKPEQSVVVPKPKQTGTVSYRLETRRVWIQDTRRRGHYENRTYRVPAGGVTAGGLTSPSSASAPVYSTRYYTWPTYGGYSSCVNGNCR